MATLDEIDDSIFGYLEDDRKYAIALIGPWGSGKTRYIEGRLKAKLKEKKYKLIRVSLFGVSDNDELFSRLLNASLGIGKDIDGSGVAARSRRLLRDGGKLAKGAGAHVTSKHGVSLAATPRLLFDLTCSKKHVVVFDDAERMSASFDQIDAFGSINDLVENRGLKAVVVTSDLEKINKDIREKLIWKSIHFSPDSKELTTDLCSDIDGAIADVSSNDLLVAAMERVQCNNARSVIKAKPLVKMLTECSVFSDPSRAASGRKAAFVEVAGFAFLKAMDKAPILPKNEEDSSGAIDEEWLDRANRETQFEHYRDVSIVERFFDSPSRISQEDVDSSLSNFMDLRYPDSEGAARMSASLDDLGHIVDVDERTAEARVRAFANAVKAADYNPSDIKRVVSRAADMRTIGINGAPSPETMLESGKRLIDKDVDKAYMAFHVDYTNWGAEFFDKDIETLEKLDRYCVDKYQESCAASAEMMGATNLNELVDWLDRTVVRNGSMPDFDVLLRLNPSAVVNLFEGGGPEVQLFINRMFRHIAMYCQQFWERDQLAADWIASIKTGLDGLSLGPVASWRRGWVIDNIQKIEESLINAR